MTGKMFGKMLQEAAKDAGVRLKIIEIKGAGPDHPVLSEVPETEYLKFYITQII